MSEQLFIKAVKSGLKFETSRGMLYPQDLYTMPLTSKGDFSLDQVSKDLLKKVNASATESLVSESTVSSDDELRLEILKYIIADIKADAKAREEAKASKERKQLIAGIIQEQETAALRNMSVEELKKLL